MTFHKDETRTRSDFSYLKEYEFVPFERALSKGETIDDWELAAAIRRYGPRPLPQPVVDYLCLHLEGKTTKRRGRKPANKILERQMHMIIAEVYKRSLAWLEAREKRYGHLKGWTRIRHSNFWKGTAAEKAARMTACRFSYGAESFRTVQNMRSRYTRSLKQP
ncbi:MAG: hypothetical protein AB7P23_09520 [Amphiplicatus sp.]